MEKALGSLCLYKAVIFTVLIALILALGTLMVAKSLTLIKAVKQPFIQRVSFLGGEPLCPENRAYVTNISNMITALCPTKTQWLYTGYKWEEIKDLPIMKYLDVVIDGQYEDDKRDITLKWRGSSNQRVIDVQESLKQNKVVLWCD